MNAIENKGFIQGIHAELGKGNGKPFVDSLAEDFRWIMKGRTAWSRTYEGKKVVQDELLKPLYAQFEGRYLNTAERFIAEGDLVVVQCSGEVATRSGKRYDNQYCFIYRLAGGKVVELTEYLDTALVDQALEAPARAG
ncbi:nuclear transport factor 2 family protein [Variovorax paradoxus]|nr:nuclear transport factor 2 family protein [Variovorax paradoxus]